MLMLMVAAAAAADDDDDADDDGDDDDDDGDDDNDDGDNEDDDRVSTESGYSSSTRQQEGELEKELDYANIFQPSAPVTTSDAENTEME